MVRGLVLGSGQDVGRELAARRGPLDDNAVVHLVVRRTAKVSWSAQGNKFELSISASDSADTVKRCAPPSVQHNPLAAFLNSPTPVVGMP